MCLRKWFLRRNEEALSIGLLSFFVSCVDLRDIQSYEYILRDYVLDQQVRACYELAQAANTMEFCFVYRRPLRDLLEVSND